MNGILNEPVGNPFVEALMAHVLEQIKIPKLQVERIIGPILGMFIPEVFSVIWNDDVKIVCPEFPLRKGPETKQSTNVDWLLYASKREELVFLELKTTDTTYDSIQHQLYRDLIGKIGKCGASFLATDIECIMTGSRERGKYREVLRRIRSDDRYCTCRQANLVYLSPRSMRDARGEVLDGGAQWLSFEDLPENIDSTFSFAGEWKVIRKHLIQLDGQTRRSRNTVDASSFKASA